MKKIQWKCLLVYSSHLVHFELFSMPLNIIWKHDFYNAGLATRVYLAVHLLPIWFSPSFFCFYKQCRDAHTGAHSLPPYQLAGSSRGVFSGEYNFTDYIYCPTPVWKSLDLGMRISLVAGFSGPGGQPPPVRWVSECMGGRGPGLRRRGSGHTGLSKEEMPLGHAGVSI